MKSMFKDNRKKLITITFTVFYIIMLILNIDIHLPFIQSPRYAINSLIIYLTPIITPALVLVFLFTSKKEYQFKKWLFPIAFGTSAIISLVTLFSSFSVINLLISNVKYIIILFCSCLTFIAIVFMFIGTLFGFKYINFLKYGALSCAILSIVVHIIGFIAIGGFAYIQSVPAGFPAINLVALIRALSGILFHIGIFILDKESLRQ